MPPRPATSTPTKAPSRRPNRRAAGQHSPGTMRHKGYTAKIAYDDQAGALRGEVIDLSDDIHFSATSVRQLRQEFHAAVDAYLLDCATRGVQPAKPFSGKLLLRLPSELHRNAVITAASLDVSLNDFLVGCVEVGVARLAAMRESDD